MSATELSSTRKKLFNALGESKAAYLKHLKSWFGNKSSKDELDSAAKKLLSYEYVHLHNRFLLAILSKCEHQDQDGLVSPSKSDREERLRMGRTKGN